MLPPVDNGIVLAGTLILGLFRTEVIGKICLWRSSSFGISETNSSSKDYP